LSHIDNAIEHSFFIGIIYAEEQCRPIPKILAANS
jgi:hypothetical protein